MRTREARNGGSSCNQQFSYRYSWGPPEVKLAVQQPRHGKDDLSLDRVPENGPRRFFREVKYVSVGATQVITPSVKACQTGNHPKDCIDPHFFSCGDCLDRGHLPSGTHCDGRGCGNILGDLRDRDRIRCGHGLRLRSVLPGWGIV